MAVPPVNPSPASAAAIHGHRNGDTASPEPALPTGATNPLGPDSAVVPPAPFSGMVLPDDPEAFVVLARSAAPTHVPAIPAVSAPLPKRRKKQSPSAMAKSPFYHFLVEWRDELRAVGEDFALEELVGPAGDDWRDMDEEQRRPYVEIAKAEKLRQRSERSGCVATAPSYEELPSATRRAPQPPSPPTHPPPSRDAEVIPPPAPAGAVNGQQHHLRAASPEMPPPPRSRRPPGELGDQDRQPLRRPMAQPQEPEAYEDEVDVLETIMEEPEEEEVQEVVANNVAPATSNRPRCPNVTSHDDDTTTVSSAESVVVVSSATTANDAAAPGEDVRRRFGEVLDELQGLNACFAGEENDGGEVQAAAAATETTEASAQEEAKELPAAEAATTKEDEPLTSAPSEEDLQAVAKLLNAIAHLNSTRAGRDILKQAENFGIGKDK